MFYSEYKNTITPPIARRLIDQDLPKLWRLAQLSAGKPLKQPTLCGIEPRPPYVRGSNELPRPSRPIYQFEGTDGRSRRFYVDYNWLNECIMIVDMSNSVETDPYRLKALQPTLALAP